EGGLALAKPGEGESPLYRPRERDRGEGASPLSFLRQQESPLPTAGEGGLALAKPGEGASPPSPHCGRGWPA
ncbi:MAG: hypothetical protein NZ602_16655, partial [Thermoguttaceae bacterium]|nr:hypothetical protein [Thermoguttaceae bacterium]MDW8039459.1 hypothetical protein [Thermoguttaceae bacterium]